jgi:type VII secretion effector (TIGR04197 family)
MGREVYVHPHEVEQHKNEMQSSANMLKDASKLNKKELSETQLASITRYQSILTQFEQVLDEYFALVESDLLKVDEIKESMIEQDTRLADWRFFN